MFWKKKELPVVINVIYLRKHNRYQIHLQYPNKTTSTLLKEGRPVPKIGDRFDVKKDGEIA